MSTAWSQAGSSQPHLLFRRRADVPRRAARARRKAKGIALHRRHRPQHRRGRAAGRGSGRRRPHLAAGHPGHRAVHGRRRDHRALRLGEHPGGPLASRSLSTASGARAVWSTCRIPTTCSAEARSRAASAPRPPNSPTSSRWSTAARWVRGRRKACGWRAGWASPGGPAATPTARPRSASAYVAGRGVSRRRIPSCRWSPRGPCSHDLSPREYTVELGNAGAGAR